MNNNIIVAFLIGRGGRYFNAGHKMFIGEKPIGTFTDDLFVRYENQEAVLSLINERKNLKELYYKAIQEDDKAALQKLKALKLDLGEQIYVTETGKPVGLSLEDEKTGIGTIDIDGEYDTIYTCKIEDCSDKELELIESSNQFKSSELSVYIDNHKQLINN